MKSNEWVGKDAAGAASIIAMLDKVEGKRNNGGITGGVVQYNAKKGLEAIMVIVSKPLNMHMVPRGRLELPQP